MFYNPDDIKDDFLVAGNSIKKIINEKNHPDFVANAVEDLLKQKESSIQDIISTLDSASVFLYERGQYNIARVLSERAVPYCKETGDKNTLFRFLNRIGNCYYSINHDFADFTDKAIEYYNNALKVAVENNDEKSQKLCRSNLDTVKNDMKQYVDVLYDKSVELYESGKYDEELELCDKILEIDANHIDTLYNKGITLGLLKKYGKAISCYDKILEIEPNRINALYAKGVALGNLTRFEEEIQCYDKILQIDANHVGALYNKGVALGNLKRYSEEITCYDKVLEIEPEHADAFDGKCVAISNLKTLL